MGQPGGGSAAEKNFLPRDNCLLSERGISNAKVCVSLALPGYINGVTLVQYVYV